MSVSWQQTALWEADSGAHKQTVVVVSEVTSSQQPAPKSICLPAEELAWLLLPYRAADQTHLPQQLFLSPWAISSRYAIFLLVLVPEADTSSRRVGQAPGGSGGGSNACQTPNATATRSIKLLATLKQEPLLVSWGPACKRKLLQSCQWGCRYEIEQNESQLYLHMRKGGLVVKGWGIANTFPSDIS